MDPNYFNMDFGRVSEVLLAIVVLSFIIERALSILFESRFFIENVEYKVTRSKTEELFSEPTSATASAPSGTSFEPIVKVERKAPSGIKEVIALAVAIGVCYFWKFDALSVIMPVHPKETWQGILITAAVVAGGSKASLKLFADWMDIRSSATKEIKAFKQQETAR